ncbi:MAG TPA: hypothetical protein VHF58_04710 [Solirubrobacterales bacterium]|nr:hypothetical protein [Solirubrobacterales bacterium]
MAERTKVEIGLGIGQVVSVKLTEKELADLRKELEAGGGWHDLTTDEGTVTINLATVVFVRSADSSHTIGFSG